MSNKEDKINLHSVKRVDNSANAILSKFPQVVLYGYDSANSTWERKPTEGALFIYSRSGSGSAYGLFLLNRLSSTSLNLFLNPSLEFMVKDRFLMLKEEEAEIYGMCFSDKSTAKLCGRDVQHLVDAGEPGALPSLRVDDDSGSGMDGRRHSNPVLPSPARPSHKQNGGHAGTESKPNTSSSRKSGSRRQRLSKSSSEPNDGGSEGAGVYGRASPTQPSRTASGGMSAVVRRQLFSGVASPPVCSSPPHPPRPQGVLSLEEVEQDVIMDSVPIARPPQATPTRQTNTDKPGAAILNLLANRPADPLSPVREVASPAHTLPSPLIGTSQDFPEKPPLMVSAGMRSDPVLYAALSPSSTATGTTPHHHQHPPLLQLASHHHHSSQQPSPPLRQPTAATTGHSSPALSHTPSPALSHTPSPALSHTPRTVPSTATTTLLKPSFSHGGNEAMKLMSPGDFSQRQHESSRPSGHVTSASSHVTETAVNGTHLLSHVTNTSGHVTNASDRLTNTLLGFTTPSNGQLVSSPKDTSMWLTKDQLKTTLIHLLQTDPAFLDSIHQAYRSTDVRPCN